MKILIILKKRQDSSGSSPVLNISTGLYNSANYVNDMLHKLRIKSKLVIVIDNNDIDREVSTYKPTHVIIEALWVVPEKFDILSRLHPKVKWIIRTHSQTPFIANEGIAMKWIAEYLRKKNVYIACNSKEFFSNMRYFAKKEIKDDSKVLYLPNYYPEKSVKMKRRTNDEYIDISCFGAIRPMKNHLIQAFAAVKFADIVGKKLRFHINGKRTEQKGENVLKNLENFFNNLDNNDYELINHEWLSTDEFHSLCKKMNYGLQCSFSETFNIVAADTITSGVPVIGTKQIPWLSNMFTCNPNRVNSIVFALIKSMIFYDTNVRLNNFKLKSYSKKSKNVWKKFCEKELFEKSNKILIE